MSALFPRNLLEEALGKSPRLIAAFEQLGDAMEAAEAKIVELEQRATALVEGGYQPRSAVLDALSLLDAQQGAVEQSTPGVFVIRPIDSADTASLLSKARGSVLFAPHP